MPKGESEIPFVFKENSVDAVIMVEILNENGMFWDWSFRVSDSVQKWYDEIWNQWLVKKYTTRDALSKAWTNEKGVSGLYKDEDANKGSVYRPRMLKDLDWDRPHRSRSRGVSRINDYYEFLSDTNIEFFKEAKAHLRSVGYKGLVSGSHEVGTPIDRYGQSTVGSISSHLYAPSDITWGARLGNADVNIGVGAVTAIQGVDESMHFSYGHRWRGQKQPDHDNSFEYINWRKAIWRSFSSANDIPWMMSNRFVSSLFVRGDFSKLKHTVHIAFSKEDLLEQSDLGLGRTGGAATIGGAANFLPLIQPLERNCKWL